MFKQYFFCAIKIVLCFCSASVNIPLHAEPAPIRFLLTFDDGPSGARNKNPTSQVLDALAHNSVQPGIKAIFFVQTRSKHAGITETGRALLQREQAEDHLLAFHTATPAHTRHVSLAPQELELSLQQGINDLTAIAGEPPQLVRPPYWNYDARTLASYHRYGLHMLLTDLSVNDGKIRGVNWSWHKRSNLLKQLGFTRKSWLEGKLPVVAGNTPVVVTFHDVNSYTARNMEVYLAILIDVANELDMPVATTPFYNKRIELQQAALTKTVRDAATQQRLPGFWNWWWQ